MKKEQKKSTLLTGKDLLKAVKILSKIKQPKNRVDGIFIPKEALEIFHEAEMRALTQHG